MTVLDHKGNEQTVFHRIVTALAQAWQAAKVRHQIRRERQMLATLDDRMLKDIGLTRAEANFEAGRSSWDVPDCRLPRAVSRDDCPSAMAQLSIRNLLYP